MIPRQITLTGSVKIKYIDDLDQAVIGDIMLVLNDDATTAFPGDYDNLVVSGYVKARVFDQKEWQLLDITEFCTNREHKFAKKQRPIDSVILCQSIIEKYKGTTIYKTYRGHFTIEEYKPRKYDRGR